MQKILSHLIHGQTVLKDTMFSVLKSVVKFLLISLRNALMDICVLTMKNMEWVMHQVFYVSDVQNKESITSILYFIASFPKLL